MRMEILTYPNPRLREKSAPVERVTPKIRELAQNMLETMYESGGVGLAAPQVGELVRLVVMDADQNEGGNDPKILINPELELSGEKIISEQEGCLSVPLGYRADVPRYSVAKVKSINLHGHEVEEVLEGFSAIVIQHETDHLEGKLFIDKMSHLRRSMYDSKVRKWLKSKSEE